MSGRVTAARIPYRDAGAAMRQASRRLAAIETVSPRQQSADLSALSAVFVLTVSYSRLDDRVALGQLVEESNLAKPRLTRALGRLDEYGISFYRPGKGRGNLSIVGVPPNGMSGQEFAELLGLGKDVSTVTPFGDGKDATAVTPFGGEVNDVYDDLANEKVSLEHPKRFHGDPVKGVTYARARSTSEEKASEKNSEKKAPSGFAAIEADVAQPASVSLLGQFDKTLTAPTQRIVDHCPICDTTTEHEYAIDGRTRCLTCTETTP